MSRSCPDGSICKYMITPASLYPAHLDLQIPFPCCFSSSAAVPGRSSEASGTYAAELLQGINIRLPDSDDHRIVALNIEIENAMLSLAHMAFPSSSHLSSTSSCTQASGIAVRSCSCGFVHAIIVSRNISSVLFMSAGPTVTGNVMTANCRL
jgi:hypothetical protein